MESTFGREQVPGRTGIGLWEEALPRMSEEGNIGRGILADKETGMPAALDCLFFYLEHMSCMRSVYRFFFLMLSGAFG